MVQALNKIFVSEKIYYNTDDYLFGDKKKELVDFVYVHKSGRKTHKRGIFTYTQALDLAYGRARDGRYKNYTYEIHAL